MGQTRGIQCRNLRQSRSGVDRRSIFFCSPKKAVLSYKFFIILRSRASVPSRGKDRGRAARQAGLNLATSNPSADLICPRRPLGGLGAPDRRSAQGGWRQDDPPAVMFRRNSAPDIDTGMQRAGSGRVAVQRAHLLLARARGCARQTSSVPWPRPRPARFQDRWRTISARRHNVRGVSRSTTFACGHILPNMRGWWQSRALGGCVRYLAWGSPSGSTSCRSAHILLCGTMRFLRGPDALCGRCQKNIDRADKHGTSTKPAAKSAGDHPASALGSRRSRPGVDTGCARYWGNSCKPGTPHSTRRDGTRQV